MFANFCLVILLALSFVHCNSNHFPIQKMLYGKWEGKTASGQVEALVTIEEASMQIEFVNEPTSLKTHQYELSEDAGQLHIRIEGVEEPLIVIFAGKRNMYFELKASDRSRADVPRLCSLRFNKVGP